MLTASGKTLSLLLSPVVTIDGNQSVNATNTASVYHMQPLQ